MKRILSMLYTLATVLIIVGALFILQEEHYGLAVLTSGIGLNIVYRLITLQWNYLREFKFLVIAQFVGILILAFACVLLFVDSDQKFNFLILAIVLDVALNYKEISLKSKK